MLATGSTTNTIRHATYRITSTIGRGAASTRISLCYLDRIGQIVSPAGTTISQSATGSYPVPGRAGGGTVLAREYVGK